tara:strand:- start:716 stop:889 length:174 start_codon:yes stop_codon:yes gene_type:complete
MKYVLASLVAACLIGGVASAEFSDKKAGIQKVKGSAIHQCGQGSQKNECTGVIERKK